MMKKIHILFVLLFPLLGIAQTAQISISATTIRPSIDLTKPDVAADIIVTNNSAQGLTVVWTREIISGNNGWQYQVCDKNSCWETNVTSKAFSLAIGESANVEVKLLHNGFLQNGVTNMKFLVQGADAASALNTRLEWQRTLKSNDVYLANDLKLYPNPTADYFQLNKYDGIAKVFLFNMVGKQVRDFDTSEARSFYVADLAPGMYLVRLVDRQGKIVKTVRLNKR